MYERVEAIDIIPDVCAYAEQQPRNYDVVELLRQSSALDSIYLQVIDFRRVERAEVLGYVDCAPFRHTLPGGIVVEYSVLVFKQAAVCVFVHQTGTDNRRRSTAYWCNRNYPDHVVGELLRYKVEQHLQVLTFGKLLSDDYADSFILHNDRPLVREIPSEGMHIPEAILVRCDDRVVPTESITVDGASVSIRGFDLDDNYNVTMDLDEFVDQYKVYRECVNRTDLPFHINETRWR